ncbi:MAG: hypothetical protein HKP58_06465 [Desulfatitalea sp.]|nr:hypothetical protein [Desulfatitalea sp.]
MIKSSSGGHDFGCVYVCFFPVYIESTSAQRHYRITSTVENPVNGNTLWTANNENLSVGHNTCEYDVVSYLLGHNRNSLARKRGAPANPSIVKNDLEFIRTWFRDQMGDDDGDVTLEAV